jgi:hypothetical protein
MQFNILDYVSDELNNVKMLIRQRLNLGNGQALTEGVS